MESSGQKRLGEVTELANQEGDYVFKLLPIVRLPGAKCNRVWKWVKITVIDIRAKVCGKV